MPIASVDKRKGSPCQQENISQGGKKKRSSGPELPEDIWYHIHSLLPLRDAARASCVSRAFLCSWRCHPNLTFRKVTMGLQSKDPINHQKNCQTFIDSVDQIMKNHRGIGVKIFKFEYYGSYYFDPSQLNSWLQIVVTPGKGELDIFLYLDQEKYNFPCSLLFAGSGGKSIRSLHLSGCTFRPMAGLGCLTRLHLREVHITGDELGKLAVIENKAPNLRTVSIVSDVAHISVGDSLQVKDLKMVCDVEFNLVYHARAKLPASMPNLETLSITSVGEMFSTPSVPGKFLHLKHLNIDLDAISGAFSPNYDYLSLLFFLDACPILETLRLEVMQTRMKHDSVKDPSLLRQMLGHRHGNIKKVKIGGFCSAKSMVELTCHILENATSPCLTLDILPGYREGFEDVYRLSDHKSGKCAPFRKHMIMEAPRALLAIERYVAVKVPSTVKFKVLKPCSRCHVLKSRKPNAIAPNVV